MGCTVLDVATMVYRCPCLRVLKMSADTSTHDVTVQSASLQELELVVHEPQCEGIHRERVNKWEEETRELGARDAANERTHAILHSAQLQLFHIRQ